MKKLLFTIILISCFAPLAHGQYHEADKWNYYWDWKAHNKGQIHFHYGYGFPRLEDQFFNHQDQNAEYRVEGVGPFYFKAEYGLTRQLSIMLSTAYVQYTSDWKEIRFDTPNNQDLLFLYGTKVHDIAANIRLNYHLFVSPRWDIYVGGGVGYNHYIVEDFTQFSPEDTTFNSLYKPEYPIGFEMGAGVRYFFLNRTAVYLEAGYGKSIVQGGFIFKFRAHKRN